jgi:class 3 adenylate cyclase
MNYDGLTASNWKAQQERVEQLRAKIEARPMVGDGRTVPGDDSLTIGDGRRLSMAMMFIDICDFSKRNIETLEEQGLMLKVLNLFFTEMIRICEEYGGNVEKNTGDGLMIYFNDQEGNPPEVGSKRAVACALTMLASTEILINPILRNSGVSPIEFRTSIDHGNVTVAKIGAPRRFSANTAIGSTANFACKMLKHAGKNEIIIGENAKQQLPQYWQNKWVIPCQQTSGWTYIQTGLPYKIYKYIGRWSRLV